MSVLLFAAVWPRLFFEDGAQVLAEVTATMAGLWMGASTVLWAARTLKHKELDKT